MKCLQVLFRLDHILPIYIKCSTIGNEIGNTERGSSSIDCSSVQFLNYSKSYKVTPLCKFQRPVNCITGVAVIYLNLIGLLSIQLLSDSKRLNLHIRHIGLVGLHLPRTHLAVLFSGIFNPYPFPHAILMTVPGLNDTLGSLPCFTTSTFTNGSLDSGSQGPRFLCLGLLGSPSSFSGFSSSILFFIFLLVLLRLNWELELLWLVPNARLPLPPFSALLRRFLECSFNALAILADNELYRALLSFMLLVKKSSHAWCK